MEGFEDDGGFAKYPVGMSAIALYAGFRIQKIEKLLLGMHAGLRVDVAGVVSDGVLGIPERRRDDLPASAMGHQRHDAPFRVR